MPSFITAAVIGLLALVGPAASLEMSVPDLADPKTLPSPLPSRLLHKWPKGSWVENISVRPNGNLLVTTSTPDGSVWEVREPWKENPEVVRIYNFDEWVDRLIGIGQTSPDKYVVVGSRFYSTRPFASHVDRTFAAMELDFSGGKKNATARLINWFPDASLLQSPSALPWDTTTVIISDQYLIRPRADQQDWTPARGKIWRLNTETGEREVIYANRTALDTEVTVGMINVGINGLKIRGDHLYWANMDAGHFYRIPIDRQGYPTPRDVEPELLAREKAMFNDFTFGPGDDDTIWAAGLFDVWAVSPRNGSTAVVGGAGTNDPLSFPGCTATAFGRTKHDSHVLYVTGQLEGMPESFDKLVLGGWVRAIDTRGFSGLQPKEEAASGKDEL